MFGLAARISATGARALFPTLSKWGPVAERSFLPEVPKLWPSVKSIRPHPKTWVDFATYAPRRIPKTLIGGGLLGSGVIDLHSLPFFGDGEEPAQEAPWQRPAMPLLPLATNATSGDIGGMYNQYQSFVDQAGLGEQPVAPDYTSFLTSPEVAQLVDDQIAAMQSPYNRAIKRRTSLGDKQAESLAAMGRESQRTSKALRGEQAAAREKYAGQARERDLAAQEAMARIGERLMGQSNIDELFTKERGAQAKQSIGRSSESQARAADVGAAGSLSSENVMAEMDAVEQMQTARDIRDAREQTQMDVSDIEGQIADIAAQRPDVLRKYASDLYSNELNKFNAESQNYQSKLGALTDFYNNAIDSLSKDTGSDFDMASWINEKMSEPGAITKEETTAGSIEAKSNPMSFLRERPEMWNQFQKELTQYIAHGYDPRHAAEYLLSMYGDQYKSSIDELSEQFNQEEE